MVKPSLPTLLTRLRAKRPDRAGAPTWTEPVAAGFIKSLKLTQSQNSRIGCVLDQVARRCGAATRFGFPTISLLVALIVMVLVRRGSDAIKDQAEHTGLAPPQCIQGSARHASRRERRAHNEQDTIH